VSLARLIRPTTRYRPDIEGAAGGTDAHRGRRRGHLGRVARHRSAVALADRLGTPLVGFPGDHGGFMALPEQFGRVLD
jgi:clorobiocin/coumermycin A biosynthesis protein CloN7/CouN7